MDEEFVEGYLDGRDLTAPEPSGRIFNLSISRKPLHSNVGMNGETQCGGLP